uniref:Secreted protein n=1 Tax=Ascaris lumbricoides TaxID=6252 RepID=A0A0M3I1Q9_ASCLU
MWSFVLVVLLECGSSSKVSASRIVVQLRLRWNPEIQVFLCSIRFSKAVVIQIFTSLPDGNRGTGTDEEYQNPGSGKYRNLGVDGGKKYQHPGTGADKKYWRSYQQYGKKYRHLDVGSGKY